MQVRTRRFPSRCTWVWGGSILKYGGTSSTGKRQTRKGGKCETDIKKGSEVVWERAVGKKRQWFSNLGEQTQKTIPAIHRKWGLRTSYFHFSSTLIGNLKVNRKACQKAHGISCYCKSGLLFYFIWNALAVAFAIARSRRAICAAEEV